MTGDQRKALAHFRGVGGKPLPLFALFPGTSVSSRADVQRIIDALVKHHYIEESLGTARMPFYRLTKEGAGCLGL